MVQASGVGIRVRFRDIALRTCNIDVISFSPMVENLATAENLAELRLPDSRRRVSPHYSFL
jgi:hypothetical protein